jgi:dTMP kinase
MKLIVIEGLDGAGKSTQVELLRQYIEAKGKKVYFLHFPRTNDPFYGEMISRFLRGELGTIDKVDPYLVAMLYAGDRANASKILNEWLLEDAYVVLDRYVCSNIAFQCAKLSHWDERKVLADWILRLEYEYHGIPRPSVNLFLDVPFEFTRKKLTSNRQGDDRSYLNGSTDIHEADLDFQQQVREVYLRLTDIDKSLQIVDCKTDSGQMLKPEQIFDKVKAIVFPNEK